MCLRWFGPGYDPVTLEQIRQIPGIGGVITTLHGKKAGEQWTNDEIRHLKETVNTSGLELYGIESVNVSDEIKVGHPQRDLHIDRYIKTLKALSDNGIQLVCYNFMSVFDWTRTDLYKKRPDGTTVFAYDQKIIDQIDPEHMFKKIGGSFHGFEMPGWEPERLSRIKELFKMYEPIDEDKLFENMVYFLEAIMPTCEQYGVKMAVHIDDPAWNIFGLPRIVKNKEDLLRITQAVDSDYNGVTLCTGSLSSNPENDIPSTIRALKGKIHFAHVRNTKHTAPGAFEETAHLSSDGSLDMYEIMKAFHDIGFDGPIRPDHGRGMLNEKAMPGYGLFDRALGSQYLIGLMEAIEKQHKKG